MRYVDRFIDAILRASQPFEILVPILFLVLMGSLAIHFLSVKWAFVAGYCCFPIYHYIDKRIK